MVDSPSGNNAEPDAMPTLHRPIGTLFTRVTTSARVTAKIATALAAGLLATISQAETLVDIYELALENDAQLKAQIAQYNADIELEKLALAPLLPQARAGYSYTDSENDSTRPNLVFVDNPVPGQPLFDEVDVTSVTETETDGYDVSLSQTLFDLSACSAGRPARKPRDEQKRTFPRHNRI